MLQQLGDNCIRRLKTAGDLLSRQAVILEQVITLSQCTDVEGDETPQPTKKRKKSFQAVEAWRCTTHPHYTRAVGELCLDAYLQGAGDYAVQNAKACTELIAQHNAPSLAKRVIGLLHGAEPERCRVISSNHTSYRPPAADEAEAAGPSTAESSQAGAASAVEELYGAVVASLQPELESCGLSQDEFGVVLLIASCKLLLTESSPQPQGQQVCNELEEALTKIWHGGPPDQPTYRFELVPGPNPPCDTLVVAFSSLGDYLIRPEFRKTLQDLPCARLFVMDPSCSWYWNCPNGSWEGFAYYEAQIATMAKGFRRVVMLGDSMGGSGALLYSHLATLVISFVPQVDLEADIHVRREDFTPPRKRAFTERVLASIRKARTKANPAWIEVHRGRASIDSRHTELLKADVEESYEKHAAACREASAAVEPFVVVVHDCDSHFVSTNLKKQGLLKPYIASRIARHSTERQTVSVS